MSHRPLADRMRPINLDEFVGQSHIIGKGMPLRESITQDKPHSMILWGAPGTGKTTLASLMAGYFGAQFIQLSAVLSGVKEIRQAVAQAQDGLEIGQKSLLFIDEVHRFNKSQQDAFLPHVENGTVTFIGATTENPSFELNNALLSRARTYKLEPLSVDDIQQVLHRAIEDSEKGLGDKSLNVDVAALELLAESADGDARRALNGLEIAAELSQDGCIDLAQIKQILQEGHRRFDKSGDVFYDQISALHKSVRGSSPDAALYWMCRMLEGGCDPHYIARRLVRIASEDIGNADPRALTLALNAWDTQQRLGSPEGELALAQAVLYLASAAKSNAVYQAYKAVMKEIKQEGSYEVPLHLRNAPTRLMSSLDYGKGYRYAHDEPDAYASGENYFPEEKMSAAYYHPVDRGLEIKIKAKLNHLKELDRSGPIRYRKGFGRN